MKKYILKAKALEKTEREEHKEFLRKEKKRLSEERKKRKRLKKPKVTTIILD